MIDMAISVNREGNLDGSIDLTINIATTQFFNEFWERAIKEKNVKIFRENGHFEKSQLDEVLDELEAIKKWAETNLAGTQQEYMKERIENLIDSIPKAFNKDDTILYIY